MANDSIPNLNFIKHCKESDAYFLYSYKDVSYGRTWANYKRQTSVNNKLVINTNSGVEKFAFLKLPRFISDNLSKINIKTLKADGTVVELDSSTVFRHKVNDHEFNEINYPIPGVEPGDTIETSYVFTEYLKYYEVTDFIDLYSGLPSMNTEYTVKTSPDLSVHYKLYNKFPEPEIISNDTLLYCVFKMKNIKGLEVNKYTCLPCELPYAYYSIENRTAVVRTWKDIYNEEFNIITQPFSLDYDKSSYYKKWKRKVIGEAKDSSKYYKFELLYADILENIQMEPLKSSELIKSSGYFLKEKRFNPISIRRLLRQILEDLEIEYSAVFARSKQSGPIDPYYIRMGEYDHIFFAYDNGKGSINLLYPHEEYYKYQINEIPTTLYNTEGIMAKPYLKDGIKKKDKFIDYNFQLAEVDSVTVKIIKLPGMNADQNSLRQVYFCDVKPNDTNPVFKYRFSISGGLSTDIRSFYSMLDQNKEMGDFYEALAKFEGNENHIKIDTVTSRALNNQIPFNYSVNAIGTVKDALTFLNDSIVSVSLHSLIQHNQIDSESDSSDLNYYLDYGYNDQCMIMLNFPCKIEVLENGNNNIDYKNDLGEYLFYFEIQGKNDRLIIQSVYKIVKDKIPKGDYGQLKRLNKLVEESEGRHLIIKLKK